jgi:hypothetical protein
MSTKFTFEGVIRCQTVIEAENYDEAKAKYDELSNADVIEGNDERDVDDWWTDEVLAKRKAARSAPPKPSMPRREPADIPPEYGGPISMKP